MVTHLVLQPIPAEAERARSTNGRSLGWGESTTLEPTSDMSVTFTSESVIRVSRQGRVEFANSTAKQLLCGTPLEVGGHLPELWLGFRLRDFVAGALGTNHGLVAGARVTSKRCEHAFEITGIPVPDGLLLVVRDVSEAERRRRGEREFVANAAHEIRTPLSAIASAVTRLQAGAHAFPDKRERFLGHIKSESDRLNRLAASLLVLERAQTRGQPPPRREIVVRALLESLAAELDLNAGVQLVITCDQDLVAYSNRDLLEHALLNLLSNAAHHTFDGRIDLSARPDNGGGVMIEISDTGVGIPHEELGLIFERFYRGRGDQGSAGFGLGLAIAREAVQTLGGRLEIDSVIDAGTTACIALPGRRHSTTTLLGSRTPFQ